MNIRGHTITNIRRISDDELEHEGWEDNHKTAFVLELDNGVRIYASSDDDGNSPGTLFYRKGEETFYVGVELKEEQP